MLLPVWLPGPMFLLGGSVPGLIFLPGGLCPGGLCKETPPTSKSEKQAIQILLEWLSCSKISRIISALFCIFHGCPISFYILCRSGFRCPNVATEIRPISGYWWTTSATRCTTCTPRSTPHPDPLPSIWNSKLDKSSG